MAREEEIDKAMVAYSNETKFDGCDYIVEVAIETAFIAGAMWADKNPQPIYIVLRYEEHSDYVEKVFFDKAKAEAYCKKFNDNPREYSRGIETMEITL